MKTLNQISRWTWAYIAMSLVLATAAGAKAGSAVLKSGQVSGVEIAVWGTGDDEVRLSYGETVKLEAGEEVTLRAYAPRGHAPNPGRWYLPGTFYVTSGGNQVRLSEIDSPKGFCKLTAVQSISGRAAQITFRLANHIGVTRSDLRQGTVNVYVDRSSTARPPDGWHPGLDVGDGRTSEKEMVERLFQGILLREPGRAADIFESTIRRDGYEGVIDVAHQIAESSEAEQDVLSSRVSSKAEHLESIYQYLLDLKPSEIDHRYQWRDHLEMLNDGDLVGVVVDIVRSPDFRRVHGYQSFGRRFDDRAGSYRR